MDRATTTRGRTPRLLAAILTLVLLLPSLALAPPIGAAGCVVTSAANTGDGTLRAALARTGNFAGQGCETITFAASVTSIAVTSFLSVNRQVAIQGPGADRLTIRYAGAAGLGAFAFWATTGANATISGLAVTGGNVNTGPLGGGIVANSTAGQPQVTLALDGVRVFGNTTTGNGGGIYATNATLTIANSTIEGNTAGLDGGGLHLTDSNGPVVATLTNTVVAGNTATASYRAAGIGARDTAKNGRTVALALRGSTVRDNPGDGIEIDNADINNEDDLAVDLADTVVAGHSGNGVSATSATVRATGSTISGNGASGVYLGFASLTLTNSTISGNKTGIAVDYGRANLFFATIVGNSTGLGTQDSRVAVRASVVAGNTNSAAPPSDCNVSDGGNDITSEGDNLVGATCPRIAGNGGSVGADILLTGALSTALVPTLAANGGPTPTHNVVPGGPAHDRITTDRCTVSGDQRGLPTTNRPQGAGCDIGAVEYTAAPPSPSPSPSANPSPSPSPSGPPPSFADVPPGYWAYGQIGQVAQRAITTGCGDNDLGQRLYCPERGVTRAEMAVFLTRTLGQDQRVPPTTPTFADVPADYWAYGQIEAFLTLGITTGCGTDDAGRRLFCPERGVTRAEMAAFLVRARGQAELLGGTPTFADVPPAYWAFGWIERFLALNVTTGCGEDDAGNRVYCPERGVTRAEMAVFIIRAYP